MSGLVSFLVGAHSSAVQKGVQRLLLAAPRQAAESLRARPGVNTARMPLGQRARQAAAAARLLDQLAADRYRRAHGHGFLVARLARHERARTPGQAEDECQERAKNPNHCCGVSLQSENKTCEQKVEEEEEEEWGCGGGGGAGLMTTVL